MQALKKLVRSLTPNLSGTYSSALKSFVNMTDEQISECLANAHFNIILPGKVTKLYDIPTTVPQPYYITNRINQEKASLRQVHQTEDALEGMREAGALARHVLQIVERQLEEGITTEELDLIVYNEVITCGAYPSPLGYKGFPKSCCTSINNIACHAIPDDTKLRKSDIVNVDVTVFLDGYHGDTSRTFTIGNDLDQAGRDLVSICEQCMLAGIDACQVGNTVFDVQKGFHSKLNEFLKENTQYNFVFDSLFSSHGIGTEFHTAPNLHTKLGSGDVNHKLAEGQTLTVEPILLECDSPLLVLADNWTTTSTIPLARSAQFEHTVLVTKNGPEILT